MKFQEGDYEAVHEQPVWRDRANFIFAAYLGCNEGRNEWEQLWGERIGDKVFRLCCIPFFANDLALGDEIETDENYVVRDVVRSSGNYTFRVWLGEQSSEVRSEVLSEIDRTGAEVEWSSKNLLALSIASGDAQRLADCLAAMENAGHLQYETGRS